MVAAQLEAPEPIGDEQSDDQQNPILAIARTFDPTASATIPFGSGNINDTFRVEIPTGSFILQRINTQVFTQPQLVMQNMRRYCQHVSGRLASHRLERRWEVPQVLLTPSGQDHVIGAEAEDSQQFWRAISFIAGSESFDTMQTLDQAREVGYALGMFHALISDLDPRDLADTLPGFHITPQYLAQYDRILAATPAKPSPEVQHCLNFVGDRRHFVSVLETARAQGRLPLRLMHGDPKVNNVMFDTNTGLAVSVVDLDTVKPGLVHYDIGDCLRSGCNPLGEEVADWQAVQFEADLCAAILHGYRCEAHAFLTEADYAYLYDAMRLITFELGLRFFTDYLAGNVYFKVNHPEQNLARALVQFQLTANIEAQETSLRKILTDIACPI
jgi:Ser/Thr protein kinase RdoA (MazF antagonist)